MKTFAIILIVIGVIAFGIAYVVDFLNNNFPKK
jgi:hypothetical protein